VIPEKHAAALKLHGEGKSNRAIEAELHICRKTLKKLFDKHDLKPNG
jgi:DNA-binding NarL/FixJ family response regulator